MKKPNVTKNESKRLKSLKEYNILDTIPEKDYDDLTKIASQICDTPIALISLIDESRQWFKSNIGLDLDETERYLSFCAHAILEPNKTLIVNNSLEDERFFDNPLVIENPKVVFYAGVPLVNEDGYALGTLCVIDKKVRELDKIQIESLEALANQVISQLKLRKRKYIIKQNENILKIINRIHTNFIIKGNIELAFSNLLESLLELTNSEYGFIGEVFYKNDKPYLKTHSILNITWDETKKFYNENIDKVITSGKPLISNNPYTDPIRVGLSSNHPKVNYFLGLPFLSNNKVIGMIGIANKYEGYDNKIIDLLSPFISTCSAMIENYHNKKLKLKYEKIAKEESQRYLDLNNNFNLILDRIYQAISNETGVSYLKKITEFICNEFDFNYLYIAKFFELSNEIKIVHFNNSEFYSLENSSFCIINTSLNKPEDVFNSNIFENLNKQLFKNNLHIGVNFVLKIPLKINNKIIGVLVVLNDKEIDNLEEKEKYLKILSFRIASELERSDKEKELSKKQVELKSALKKLKDTQEQIIHFERLKALGEMSSGIAHDFNNALTPILGYSELLLNNRSINEEKELYYLNQIKNSAIHSSKIIRNMRSFYRKEDSVRYYEKADLNKLIRDTIDLTKHKWKDLSQSINKYISVKFNSSYIPEIYINSTEIKEVITNLIFNAVDSIEKYGSIIISTKLIGKDVIINIIDDGHGIDELNKNKVFEPFFTTKKLEGSGLGLAMVFGIINRHKGSISFDSKLGFGTSFKISLPILEKENISIIESSKQFCKKLKVLVVEDDPDIQEVLAEYLSIDEHSYVFANNGLEGLKLFHEGYFDLILSDYGMPHMNGKDLANSIKKMSKRKPLILITGFGDLIKDEKEVENVDFVLSKPITMNSLRKAISIVMENC